MVSLWVGSHPYLSRPRGSTTISRVDGGKALPSKARTLIEIDVVILTALEPLQDLIPRLVCDMGNINPCSATEECNPRLARLNDLDFISVHLLEGIEDTSRCPCITEVVTEKKSPESPIP